MTTTTPAVKDGFAFNGDWDDLEQVAAHLDAYTRLRQEMTDAGKCPYNDNFLGQIPGIAGPDESRAIYLLSGLLAAREQQAKVERLLSEGYEHVTTGDPGHPYAVVVFYPTRQMGGRWQQWAGARLVCDDDGEIRGVLPKGKRTRGHLRHDRAVLVKR
jgi:hypothetical protein